MLYTQIAANTSQTAFTCSPRLSASVPKETAPKMATSIQTIFEVVVNFD